jgi:gas vesicle protein GvpL/GvpF
MTGLRYVYGIVPAAAAASIDAARISGIDGAAVQALAEGPFAAAQSELDAESYGADALNQKIRDMDWLTPRAEAHQAVNARLLDIAGVVLPLSFGAIYRDDPRVREMLRQDLDVRRARLEELSGKAEWVVTVVREQGQVPAAGEELRALEGEIAASAPGRGYLLEKRRTNVATAAAERADAEAARRALDVLAEAGERTYREPVATGGADVIVVRVSLLAPVARARAVGDAIASLGRELETGGYHVRSTGPWPAYRFGSLA